MYNAETLKDTYFRRGVSPTDIRPPLKLLLITAILSLMIQFRRLKRMDTNSLLQFDVPSYSYSNSG